MFVLLLFSWGKRDGGGEGRGGREGGRYNTKAAIISLYEFLFSSCEDDQLELLQPLAKFHHDQLRILFENEPNSL